MDKKVAAKVALKVIALKEEADAKKAKGGKELNVESNAINEGGVQEDKNIFKAMTNTKQKKADAKASLL